MRICFISSQYPPEARYDGGATYVYNIARTLARRGHEVNVITTTHKKRLSGKLEEGVWVWRCHEPRYRTHLYEDIRRNWQVWRVVRKIQPDLVQLNESRAEGFLLALFERGRWKLVTRISSHIALTGIKEKATQNFRFAMLNRMAQYQTRHSDAIVSPSSLLARQIEQHIKLTPGHIQQVYNGMNLQEIQSLSQVTPNLTLNEPYVAFFGRLDERKGTQYVAQAMPLVWKHFPYLKIVFVGQFDPFKLENIPSKQYVESLAGDYIKNIVFTGHLPYEQALPIVAHARLTLLPSIWEPFPNACIESIVLGVPVITTGGTGGAEEIVAGTNDPEVELDSVPAGWLVPPRDAKALANAIIEALSDGSAMQKVRANVKRRAYRFDVERTATAMEKIYQEIYATP